MEATGETVGVTFILTKEELALVDRVMAMEDRSIKPSRSAFIRKAVLAYVDECMETQEMLDSIAREAGE